MDQSRLIAQMNNNAQTIHSLTAGVSEVQARWRPDPDSWSILEVINHLNDEEREDFRVRLDYILNQPGEVPPEINPQGWITSRSYNQRDLSESILNFLAERDKSLQWLHELGSFNWEAKSELPFGTFRAGDMFAAWAAHDMLHLRQLVELHYAYTAQALKPYKVGYAGEW